LLQLSEPFDIATTSAGEIADTNRELWHLEGELGVRRAERDEAKQHLGLSSAKVLRNELVPQAILAVSRLSRRALQMVCRFLAYNAELDLARSLNTYFQDPDECRAITRKLLHRAGTIAYEQKTITVTLRSPDSPRVGRALGLLCEQLNADPPHMNGDRRPITYPSLSDW
jgi:hypothetical protein